MDKKIEVSSQAIGEQYNEDGSLKNFIFQETKGNETHVTDLNELKEKHEKE